MRTCYKSIKCTLLLKTANGALLMAFSLMTWCRCRMGLQRQKAVNLPPDVWRIISKKLTIREWARVSGTCRTTWQLQLDMIDLIHWNAEGLLIS